MRTISRLLIVTAIWAVFALPQGAAAACIGDCNDNSEVTVDEIVRGINIALGMVALSSCTRFDVNGDQMVTVEELVGAVQVALNGCPVEQSEAFIITTNFSTGSFATVDLDDRSVTPSSGERQVHPDAVARKFGGRLYVINRFMGDYIEILDPNDNFASEVTCLTGELSNPQDIAIVDGNMAYVSL
jgi:hypothetical protein